MCQPIHSGHMSVNNKRRHVVLPTLTQLDSSRFTYSYLVTTFARFKPLRLNRFQSTRRPKPTRIIVPEFLEMAQSRAATGGVYKGQGRIQSELMTRPYKEFLVHGQ
uniref:Uncharacterized protein n=1 Tax=Globodera rostochiensis TaxID=31243 RepID=A0A914HQ96_GLORO